MTKAIIQSTSESLRNAEYRISIPVNTAQAEAISEKYKQQLKDLVQPILDAEVALIELDNQIGTKATQVNRAINDAVGTGQPPENELVSRLMRELAQLTNQRIGLRANFASLKLQRASIARAKTTIDNAITADQPGNFPAVFCADYTTDIKPGAEVGLCLVPGENAGATLTIYPAFQASESSDPGKAAIWTHEKFGWLTPPYSMTPEALFYNWAMRAGWQRWMPTFRHAVITAIDKNANTANIDVEEARSSDKTFVSGVGSRGLQANKTHVVPFRLENVPIKYMDCDCNAFRVGDRVLVEFDKRIERRIIGSIIDGAIGEAIDLGGWDNPKIIGFVDGPRPCPVFVESGWLDLSEIGIDKPALVYPTPEVGDAENDDPSFLDEDIFEDSLNARIYYRGMDSEAVLNNFDPRVEQWKLGNRPGNCTGLLRLGVQAQYGAKLTSFSLLAYSSWQQSESRTYGVLYKGHNFYLINIGAGTVTATKLNINPALQFLAHGKSGDALRKAQAYMLSTSRESALTASDAFDPVQGTTFAYGWHFNSDGTKASIVTEDPVFASGGQLLQYHTGRLYTMTISVSETENDDGTPKISLNVSVSEKESANYTPKNNKDLLMFPNFKENKNEHMVWYGGIEPTFIDSDAPIYCFYDESDTLQVLRHKRTSKSQSCSLSDFNAWADSVKSCDLGTASGEYECIANPVLSGFYTGDIDMSGDEGGSGYYGNLTVSGELDGSSNNQLLLPGSAGWSESKLCGPRHNWDGENKPLGDGRVRVTWRGGDRVVYFQRVQANYAVIFESLAIIPFYDAESVYIGSYKIKNIVGDTIDTRTNVTLQATAESGGGDIARLTWSEFGGIGNGVSDGSVTEGADHGVLQKFERDIKLSLQHRRGFIDGVAELSINTKSQDTLIAELGRWPAIWDPELLVYRYYDIPIVVRQSVGGELIYTGDPTAPTVPDMTETTSDSYPADITIYKNGEFSGWS